ncbi:MAG: hypothetical protein GY870_14140 [archaeon]|nr:hypothetical protein [archaeon]
MTQLKTVSWQNYNSYGNKVTTYSFKNKCVTKVSGNNGCGKCVFSSTLINIDVKDEVLKKKFLTFIREKHGSTKKI